MTGAAALVVAAGSTEPAWAAAAKKKKPVKKHHPAKPRHVARPKPSVVEHLLRRTTYAPTPALIAEVEHQGTAAWLNDQLHPTRVSDAAMDTLLKRWPSLNLNTWQVRQKYSGGAWDVMQDLVDAHIARAVWSKRQLLEIMVDFWSNHLNVTCPSSDVWDSRHLFDRDVIRKYALGSFSDMLAATAKAPAMLNYLGNAQSNGYGDNDPNENWGRELLELHTVGVGAGYSQTDVHNSALILSGLSIEDQGGQFEYKPWYHYVGKVKVMGFHSANASAYGETVAMDYLSYLAHHPDTATHLATKLAVRFVSDDPPASLIKSTAAVYRKNGTKIVPVLQHLFASTEFAHSAGAKVRTPYEDFIATLRVLRVGPPKFDTVGVRDLQYLAGNSGQPPLAWGPPNGYPDVAVAWASTSSTLGKWNNHMTLAGQWYPQDLTFTHLLDLVPTPLPKTYSELFKALTTSLAMPTLNGEQIAALAGFVDHKPSDSLASTDEAVGWRLPYLVALMLDSSHQAER
jgi:uncharacterized protein (DUF1800 family)